MPIRSFILAGVFALSLASPCAASEADTQKSVSQGVTVSVTPTFSDPGVWKFRIVLDTHSQELSDDLRKAALIDSSGKRYAPTALEGAGPGGHHREGVLRFAAITPSPVFVELQITRANEAAPRSFRWQLE